MRITGGEFRGRKIRTIEGPGYRPATAKIREAVFSMLQVRGMDWETSLVLDLFAGSGSLGIEALSRGAKYVAFVEKNKRAAEIIRKNLEICNVEAARATVHAMDLFTFLQKKTDKQYSLVFVDPPYGKNLLRPSLDLLLGNGWTMEEAYIVAEVESDMDLCREDMCGLQPVVDRIYGQTRIYIWKNEKN